MKKLIPKDSNRSYQQLSEPEYDRKAKNGTLILGMATDTSVCSSFLALLFFCILIVELVVLNVFLINESINLCTNMSVTKHAIQNLWTV